MSAISFSQLEQTIFDWLVPAYVPRAIFSKQRVPQPAFPYADITLVSSSREGGRDIVADTTDLTRAKSIRVTPVAASGATYTITIAGVGYSYTAATPTTAAAITAGLTAAMQGSPYTVTDNHGTLDLVSTAVVLVVVTTNLSWANRDYGHEIMQMAHGSRRMLWSVKFHVDEANMAAGGATAYAEAARTSLSLQSVIDALRLGGVAVVKEQGVRDLSMVVNGAWISRAVLDVILRTVVELAEDTGYIGHFIATDTSGDDFDGEVIEGP